MKEQHNEEEAKDNFTTHYTFLSFHLAVLGFAFFSNYFASIFEVFTNHC